MISIPIPPLMAERRLVAPAHITEALMVRVVQIGIPIRDAASIAEASAASAEKPWIGRNAVSFWPRVLMIRHPPR